MTRTVRPLAEAFGALDERTWLPVAFGVRQHLPTASLRSAIQQLDLERPLVATVATDMLLSGGRRLLQKVTGGGAA